MTKKRDTNLLRSRGGDIISANSLAWLWISWVRKYGLSVQLVDDVLWETTNPDIRAQAQIVVDYFAYRTKHKGPMKEIALR